MKKNLFLGIFSIVLIFGLVFTGCKNDDDSDSGGASSGNSLIGSWAGKVGGDDILVAITATAWTMTDIDNPAYSDNGTYTMSGNTATLYSTKYNLNTGTATDNGNNTITVNLNDSSWSPGSHTLIKQ